MCKTFKHFKKSKKIHLNTFQNIAELKGFDINVSLKGFLQKKKNKVEKISVIGFKTSL